MLPFGIKIILVPLVSTQHFFLLTVLLVTQIKSCGIIVQVTVLFIMTAMITSELSK
jgi:ABC-type taurine transport system substrate-binding protein